MPESDYRPRKGATNALAKRIPASHVTPLGDVASIAVTKLIGEYHRQCRGLHPIVARAIANQLADALRTMAECIVVGKEECDD